MTHNIIHDEDVIEEIVLQWLDDKSMIWESKMAMKQYAEHTLVKFIDEQVERLGKELIEIEIGYGDNFFKQPFGQGRYAATQDQITHLQSLKAQLTKSK